MLNPWWRGAAASVDSVHEPKTLVRGNALGAVMRTFANVPGSITAQRAMPRRSLTSLEWKMNCSSDIHAPDFACPAAPRGTLHLFQRPIELQQQIEALTAGLQKVSD